jgi:protein arginine kinase
MKKIENRTAEWLSGKGKDNDIVISSRARLARNLQDIPFVNRASENQQKEILKRVLQEAKNTSVLHDAIIFNMLMMDELDREFLVERRLISTDFAESENPRALIVTEDQTVDIMVNEEDHVRLNTICSGFSLKEAWYVVHRLERELAHNLDFAYSEQFGYLTACPSNVGTGVRFSVFLHLPVLIFTNKIEEVFAELIPAGIAVRGFYGEGSKVIGNFFQISNQYTLGWTEQGILDRVMPLIHRFIEQERKARDQALKEQKVMIEDKIYRALGLLSHARVLSSIEFLDLLSALRLGVDLGIIQNIEKKVLNELMVLTQPAHIQKVNKRRLDELKRDTLRASMVREKLHLN